MAVVPPTWEPGHKAPRLTGILPSKTFKEGRVEGWASQPSDTQAENSSRRSGSLVLPGAPKAPKAEKPEKSSTAAKAGGVKPETAKATGKPKAK